MLTPKRSASVALRMHLWRPLYTSNKAQKQGDFTLALKPRVRQNRGISWCHIKDNCPPKTSNFDIRNCFNNDHNLLVLKLVAWWRNYLGLVKWPLMNFNAIWEVKSISAKLDFAECDLFQIPIHAVKERTLPSVSVTRSILHSIRVGQQSVIM